MFTAAVFITSKTWKQPKYPSADEWIHKCISIQRNIIQSKTNEILLSATTCMSLENIMLSERNQTQKVTYYIIIFR